MIGVITGWDILTHPAITVECFGWNVFFRAIFQGRNRTFLSLLPTWPPTSKDAARLAMLVDRCVDLEYRAKQLYTAFASAFADRPEASRFFDTLASQEQTHADLLALCSDVARRGFWLAEYPNPWERLVPGLESYMQKIEESLHEIISLEDALRLVIQIESGEINRNFQTILASCDVAFVQRLSAFRHAVEIHATLIADQVPKLAPQLRSSAEELRALFPCHS